VTGTGTGSRREKGRRAGAPGGKARVVAFAGRVLPAAAVALAAFAAPAAATVWRVPLDEPTLDRAMLRAFSGDTVKVAPGIYPGPVRLAGGVRLEGVMGPALTVITAEKGRTAVTVLPGGPTTALVGFTVRGGRIGIDVPNGVASLWNVEVTGSDSVGVRCGSRGHLRLFASTVTGVPVGVDLEPGADGLIMKNTFERCGTAVRVAAEDARVFRNTFGGNEVGVEATGKITVAMGGAPRDANDFLPGPGLAVRAAPEASVEAGNNWWGSADCDSIRAHIEGPVTFLPFVDADHGHPVESCP
jgi:hypothetical protein